MKYILFGSIILITILMILLWAFGGGSDSEDPGEGQLAIDSVPSGATVRIEGKDEDFTTPDTILLEPGVYMVWAYPQRIDLFPYQAEVRIDPEKRLDLMIEFEEHPSPQLYGDAGIRPDDVEDEEQEE